MKVLTENFISKYQRSRHSFKKITDEFVIANSEDINLEDETWYRVVERFVDSILHLVDNRYHRFDKPRLKKIAEVLYESIYSLKFMWSPKMINMLPEFSDYNDRVEINLDRLDQREFKTLFAAITFSYLVLFMEAKDQEQKPNYDLELEKQKFNTYLETIEDVDKKDLYTTVFLTLRKTFTENLKRLKVVNHLKYTPTLHPFVYENGNIGFFLR